MRPLSSCDDGLSEPENPDKNRSNDDAAGCADRLPATAPISIVIPPLDLSTLHRHDGGEIYFTLFLVE